MIDFCLGVSDVTLNKEAKQFVAKTMMNEKTKQEPSIHLQALKIFINLFPKGIYLIVYLQNAITMYSVCKMLGYNDRGFVACEAT